ncbi:hypothetical protein [Corynebacterium sp. Marseille-P4321]|uniref:hypothetical protein n=1 Tax=Corynebacterium sp. Marseille-P4321 TaxID=2736603 RepID=UPI00158AFAED|nr:hypothetical protein [Corynebacterium sp. Marseille-P4321]
MRLPALTVAAALTLAAASPAIAATTTVSAPAPIEQLLIDVSVLHADSLKALKKAEDNEDAVRDVLDEWRLALIDAEDELAELREDARDLDGKLTKAQAAEFDEARETIREERAEVRELRVELLPADETVYVPEAVRVLGGLLDVVAVDAVERSAEGKNIVYGLPGVDGVAGVEGAGAGTAAASAAGTAAAAPATTATKPTEPAAALTPAAPAPAAPAAPAPTSVRYTAERMTGETTTETETTTNGTETNTESNTATTTTTGETTTSSTTSETTTAPTSIMENRRTSASTTTTPTTSSTYSSTSTTPTTTSTWDDDDERDDDLAETGSPMLSLIVLGALATLAGLVLMRRPA